MEVKQKKEVFSNTAECISDNTNKQANKTMGMGRYIFTPARHTK